MALIPVGDADHPTIVDGTHVHIGDEARASWVSFSEHGANPTQVTGWYWGAGIFRPEPVPDNYVVNPVDGTAHHPGWQPGLPG